MALFALYSLGLILCLLGTWLVCKQILALRKTILYQKQVLKSTPDAVIFKSGQGWMAMDVILALFSLFAAASSQLSAATDSMLEPETLCFIGIAIYCVSRVLRHANDGRIVFGPKAFVYHDESIPYSSVLKMTPDRNQVEVKTRDSLFLVSKKQAEEIEKHKKNRKKVRCNR